MKVRELVAALLELNQELEIIVPMAAGDYKDADLYAGSDMFYRSYRLPDRYTSDWRHEQDEPVTAVVLS